MTLTSVPAWLIRLGQYFQQTVLRTLDIQMQKNEAGPVPNKNYLKIDQEKIWRSYFW